MRCMSFDPDAAAAPDSGIFGLPHAEADAAVVLLPVPFDATTSYRDGTLAGPAAILEASRQVDLWDLQFGRAFERGIHMREIPEEIVALSHSARLAAEPILAHGGPRGGDFSDDDQARIAQVDEAGERVRSGLRAMTSDLYDAGKIVGVVGGDHSVPLGAIEAAAARFGGLGILHVDAHMDLRHAYEGFRFSHASIMDNVLERCGKDVARLVQVGIRDVSEGEVERMRQSDGQVQTYFDLDVARRLARGETRYALFREIAERLPENVWVSFDIDGLEPGLCPGTGTPVPGGLSFQDACLLLEALQEADRRIVGFDLCEVAPRDLADWDAIVGARVLYKLCGLAIVSSAL
jgi:agmatinase